jgi:hypothetical protein
MIWQDGALSAAGVIGSGVAVVHGILLQRRMVEPIKPLLELGKPMSGSIRRLVPVLLHFSTFNWFLSGIALISAAIWLGPEAKLAIGLLVGSSYLFGAIGNFWGTRGRHPGWVLYGVALALVILGLGFKR